MPNNYLKALREMTERRERFNEWTLRLHAERGIPTSLPLVLREGSGDTELEDYLAEGQAMLAGESAFFEKYGRAEDPHAVED